jgi:nucleoside-diphosphate-sugar epimerase
VLISRSGTGYIGSFTVLALLEADYKVVIVDNLYNSSQEVLRRIELVCGKRPEFVQLNVTDEKAFDKVFEAYPDIDSVIHFAALKVSETGPPGDSTSGWLFQSTRPMLTSRRLSASPASGHWTTTTRTCTAACVCCDP